MAKMPIVSTRLADRVDSAELVQKLNAIFLQQFESQIAAIEIEPGRVVMSIIGRWALQGVVLFLFAWMATVVAQWSAGVVRSTSSDRLAAFTSVRLSTEAVTASGVKSTHGTSVGVGALAGGSE